MNTIHSTALIDPSADIGDGVTIGPYSIIGPLVQISDGVTIGPHVVINKLVKIGPYSIIGPFSIIGAVAESIKELDTPQLYSVVIGSNTILNGLNTIDAGTWRNTELGDSCFIMKGAHVGHDAIINNSVIMSPRSLVGGHAEIGESTNMGMGSIVHQRIKVPRGCMLGMGAIVTKTTRLIDNGCYVGNPAKWLRYNQR